MRLARRRREHAEGRNEGGQGASHNRPPERPQRHNIPASRMTAQSGERERRDIDPGEGRGTGAERVHDRRSNDRGVRDGQRHAFARQRLREPGAGRLIRPATNSPPCGAAAGSASQAANSSGSRSATSFEARPRQRP